MNNSSGNQLGDLIRGLVYTHNRANANTAEAHQANATLHALIGLLTDRGMLDTEEFEARKEEAAAQLKRQYLERGMAVAMQEFGVSKYEFANGAEIDCENRLDLCKAACCRLPFALSREDVQEGLVQWDLGQPYMNARKPDGYCLHMKSGSCQCSIYQNRPIPCRGYDCRQDRRIWLDFENRVVNPQVRDENWPASLEMTATQPGGVEHG